MTRCSVCGAPCVREVEPAITRDGVVVLPAETESDVWEVVFRNRLVFPACDQCWGIWPDEWKRFPEYGLGRSPHEQKRTPEFVTLDDFDDVPSAADGWPVEATSAYDLTLDQFLACLREAA